MVSDTPVQSLKIPERNNLRGPQRKVRNTDHVLQGADMYKLSTTDMITTIVTCTNIEGKTTMIEKGKNESDWKCVGTDRNIYHKWLS